MRSFDAQLSSMVVYDLAAGFSNVSISDGGELQVPNSLQHPLYLKVGEDILMLTMLRGGISLDADCGEAREVTGYVLANLSAGLAAASILFDNELVAVTGNPGTSRFQFRGGKVITIGRDPDATPELSLSASASRKHAIVRTGNIRGNLHFMDMDSTLGTSVFLHPDDAEMIAPPRRLMVRVPGEFPRPATVVEQRWFRPRFEKEVILSEVTASNSR